MDISSAAVNEPKNRPMSIRQTFTAETTLAAVWLEFTRHPGFQ